MPRATSPHLVGAPVPAAIPGSPAPLPCGIDPATSPPWSPGHLSAAAAASPVPPPRWSASSPPGRRRRPPQPPLPRPHDPVVRPRHLLLPCSQRHPAPDAAPVGVLLDDARSSSCPGRAPQPPPARAAAPRRCSSSPAPAPLSAAARCCFVASAVPRTHHSPPFCTVPRSQQPLTVPTSGRRRPLPHRPAPARGGRRSPPLVGSGVRAPLRPHPLAHTH
nr:basic proline-rich protein-like [Aegilops tauschii subsp. strangulata]